jgi:hypothetical protein
MKVGKVRDGERFVLDDRGGVWERTGNNHNMVIAKCFFGPQSLYGTEIEIDPNAYCYVIFEGPKPFGRDAAVAKVEGHARITGMKIKIVDELNDVLVRDIIDPTNEQISILAASDTIRITPHGKRKPCVFHISEFAYDFDADAFCLLVMPEREEKKDEDDRERDEDSQTNIHGDNRVEARQSARRRADPKTRSDG